MFLCLPGVQRLSEGVYQHIYTPKIMPSERCIYGVTLTSELLLDFYKLKIKPSKFHIPLKLIFGIHPCCQTVSLPLTPFFLLLSFTMSLVIMQLSVLGGTCGTAEGAASWEADDNSRQADRVANQTLQ